LIDLIVVGLNHVEDATYAFIALDPVDPADDCVDPSGNTTPGAPIDVVAMIAPYPAEIVPVELIVTIVVAPYLMSKSPPDSTIVKFAVSN
jgi:hypothetical protein